jgi:hypothetical protein
LLSKEIQLQNFLHMSVQPHINEPPRTS